MLSPSGGSPSFPLRERDTTAAPTPVLSPSERSLWPAPTTTRPSETGAGDTSVPTRRSRSGTRTDSSMARTRTAGAPGAEERKRRSSTPPTRTSAPEAPPISARDFGRRARLATAPRGMARADPHSARRSAKRAQMRPPRIRNAPVAGAPPDRPASTPVADGYRTSTRDSGAARNFGRRAQLRRRARLATAPRGMTRADPQTAGRSASPAHPQRPRSPPPTTPTRGTTSRRNGVSTYEEEVP